MKYDGTKTDLSAILSLVFSIFNLFSFFFFFIPLSMIINYLVVKKILKRGVMYKGSNYAFAAKKVTTFISILFFFIFALGLVLGFGNRL
jgi:hypothetical protein